MLELNPEGDDIYAVASRRAIAAYANCIAVIDPERALQLYDQADSTPKNNFSGIVNKFHSGALTWERAYSILRVTYCLRHSKIIEHIGTR